MVEPASQRAPLHRTIPWGLIGFLVLAGGVERFVARNALDFTRPDNWEWRLNGRAAVREARSAGVLALGSSVVKQGVVPRAIAPAVGRPVFNLGMCAGSPPASYFLLRRALDAGARPKTVLVEFHTGMLTESPWLTSVYWPEILDLRDSLDLALAARDARLFGAVTLARLLPSVRDRYTLRSAVLGALQGNDPSERVGALAVRRNVRTNLGAKLAPPRPGGATAPLPGEADSWACTPLNDRYIRRFLDLTARHGVTVVWLLPPVRPDLQAKREANGVDAAYKAYACGLLARYRHLAVVDATRSGFPADSFIDGQHLDRRGALALSAGLAGVLRDASRGLLSPGLWLPLPAPTGAAAPVAVAVEDMAESNRAVRRGLITR